MADDWYTTPENKKNQAYWKKRLAGQGELKASPPRSAWRRFMDSVEETVKQGPGALIGARIAPLVETGDGKTYEQRRQQYNTKEKQRREDVAAVDPADSVGDYAADIAGGIVGSVISDPTNLVNPVGGIGRRIAGNAAVGGLGDAALQGGEMVEGLRDEYDPLRTAVNVAAAPAIIGGAELVKKGVKAVARPPKDLDIDTAVGIGNKFGTVTSTVRTPARNKKVGGAKNSYHLSGRAIDIARGKGVTHKQIERAYRRAGYDIIESLDEGDHSHLAFNFKASKPNNVVDLPQKDPVADQAPLLDSSHEKFTPYVDRPNDPANDPLVEDIMRQADNNIEDVLTPAERQEMDASAVRPEIDPIDPAGLGRGIAGDPANDINVHDIKDARETKELKGFHKDLMGEIGKRAREIQELGERYHEEGKLPYKIGDRFTTEFGRERGDEPWTVIGYSVDPKDPTKYGYHVERGKKGTSPDDHDSTYEKSVMLRSNPKFDEKMMKDASYKERTGKDWVPLHERNDWQVVGKPKLSIIKDIIDDDKGVYRPDWREHRARVEGQVEQVDPVEARLIKDLKTLKPLTGEQRRMYREERGRRASSLSNLQKGDATRENVAQQFASQRGQLPRRAYESIAENYTEADWTALANRINHSPKLLPFQKLNGLKALNNLLGVEGAKLPTPSEIKLLSEVYSNDFVKALLENRPFLTKVWEHTKSALNVPRAIMSSMDFSAPFRQGIGLVHKKEFWKSLPHMFKMWASEVKSKDWHDSVVSHPRWQQAHDAGLAITNPHSHFLADKEEDFMTDWAERIPLGGGKMIAASNRAYSGFLNKLRWDTFNNLLDQMENMGEKVDGKRLKQLGKFVNMATGRGDLGKTGNAAAPALSAMLFSPRLIASRVKTLASPVTYMNADPTVRKEAWKSLLGMSAYYMTLGGIAKYGMGMDVETDPRSPDFMKAKIGNTRYDFMAGYGQYIRLGAQILTDSTITAKGKERELTGSEEYRAPTRRDVAIKFLLNKLAPVPSLVSDWMEGSDPTGEPFTWKKAISSRMLPMASQDIADAVTEWGPKGAAMGLPGLIGWSVQTYDADKPKDKAVKKEKKQNKEWYSEGEKPSSKKKDDWYS